MMKYRMFFLVASIVMMIVAAATFLLDRSSEGDGGRAVYISKKELFYGDVVNGDDFILKKIDVSDKSEMNDYVANLQDYIGYIYNENLSSGIPLKKSYLVKESSSNYSEVIKNETSDKYLPMMLPNRVFEDSFLKDTIKQGTKNKYTIRAIFKFANGKVISRQISRDVRVIKCLKNGVVVSMPPEKVLELQTALHEDSFISLSIFDINHSSTNNKTGLDSADASLNIMELKGNYD